MPVVCFCSTMAGGLAKLPWIMSHPTCLASPAVSPSTAGPAAAAVLRPHRHTTVCSSAQRQRLADSARALRHGAQLPGRLAFDPLLLRLQHVRCSAAAGLRQPGNDGQEFGRPQQQGQAQQNQEAQQANASQEQAQSRITSSSDPAVDDFCIIESRDSVRSFDHMQLDEIDESIKVRRDKIFLLMEEVRRLRIQQRMRGTTRTKLQDLQDEKFPSVVPFLPPLSDKTVKFYLQFYAGAVATIIIFGGLLAPILEVRLGLGGTSYADFIGGLHLPGQLAQVDPIVASFCGGAVGVLSALLVVEANNAATAAKQRCTYCEGTGYLTCGNCTGTGAAPDAETALAAGGSASAGGSCAFCSGTGKVMCTSCLCTGKAMATEHDPRIDPWV